MNREELLIKAIKDYPIGTVVDSLGGYRNEKVNSVEFNGDKIRTVTYNNNRGILFNSTTNKWANIISLPEQQELNYEIC